MAKYWTNKFIIWSHCPAPTLCALFNHLLRFIFFSTSWAQLFLVSLSRHSVLLFSSFSRSNLFFVCSFCSHISSPMYFVSRCGDLIFQQRTDTPKKFCHIWWIQLWKLVYKVDYEFDFDKFAPNLYVANLSTLPIMKQAFPYPYLGIGPARSIVTDGSC